MDLQDHADDLKTHRQLLRAGTIDNLDNYMGDIVPDSHVFVYSRNRDSQGIEIINYNAILAELQEFPETVPEPENEDEYYTDVYVHSIGHWAVGWVDCIFVRKDTPQLLRAVELLNSIENYPCLDDDELSAHECSECNEYYEDETQLSENHLCAYCEKELIEKELEKLTKELAENLDGAGYFLQYNSFSNVFEIADYEDYFDEIIDAYKAEQFFTIGVLGKNGPVTYYTIAQTESEALNYVDIFLNGQYYTASPAIFELVEA